MLPRTAAARAIGQKAIPVAGYRVQALGFRV